MDNDQGYLTLQIYNVSHPVQEPPKQVDIIEHELHIDVGKK